MAMFDYVVPPIDGLTGDALEARLRDDERQRDHAQSRGAPRRHRPSRAEPPCLSRARLASAGWRRSIPPTASRCFSGGSLAEGWACYVCDLMEEIGFLTPLERIAQQHTRVRIAARAVADLSIHTGRADPAASRAALRGSGVHERGGGPGRGRAQQHVPRHGRDVLAGHPGAASPARRGAVAAGRRRSRCARSTIACSRTERFP